MTTTDTKVFLSIVSDEFKSYRLLLTQDLRGPFMDVKSQEDFIVGGGKTLGKLDAYIENCDAVVHLIGDATGSHPTAYEIAELLAKYSDFGQVVPTLADVLESGATDISYTQWEAYLALYHHKQLYIFRSEPGAPKDHAFRLDQSQQELQKRHFERIASLGQDRGTVADKERLSSRVLGSFLGLGWGELLPLRTEDHRLPSTDCPRLFGRVGELKMLDAAWEKETHRNVFCVVARGGMGKTALINEWWKQMKRDEFRGAKRAFIYSFYDQGTTNSLGTTEPVTSADDFFQWALDLFGGGPELKHADPATKGVELARLVRQQRTLLLLDGLEPLQVPPLANLAAEVRRTPGTLKDKALIAFLKELASDNPGLCVITTRYLVADLTGSDERDVQQIRLNPLTNEDGADLLSLRGVIGDRKELKKVSEEFGGEGLALTLLGNLLRDHYEGKVGQRSQVRNQLEAEEDRGGHAWRVMDSYEKWFSQGTGAELNVLRLLGLFDRPADGEAIKDLLRTPEIPGLTDALLKLNSLQWKGVLKKLRDADLLNEADRKQPETLNTHPLVREHFSKKLREFPHAWLEGNKRLYEHFKSRAKDLPDTFEEMRPLFIAVPYGCEAGRHLEVFKGVYWRRILREDRYHSTDNLGLFGEDLMAASCFFTRQWDQPLDQFSEEQKAQIQRAAGWDLRSLGMTEEAIQALQGSLERYERLELWEPANVSCSQIAQIHMNRGELVLAQEYAERKQRLADLTHKTFYRTGGFVLRALIAFQMGSDPQDCCPKVGELDFAKDDGHAVDHMFIAFCWCDLLLAQVASPCTLTRAGADEKRVQQVFEEIETRCVQIEEIAHRQCRPRPVREVAQLLRGRAYLLRAMHGGGDKADFTEAQSLLDKALMLLRTGPQELYLSGLRARALLYLDSERPEAADDDLLEALIVARRGKMRLYEVDCQLELVQLYLAREEKGLAREQLARTATLVQTLGYHRRDQDIAELTKSLGGDSVEAIPAATRTIDTPRFL